MELTILSTSPWGKQDHGFQDASSALSTWTQNPQLGGGLDFFLRLPCCPLWCHDAPNLADIPLGWSKKGWKGTSRTKLAKPKQKWFNDAKKKVGSKTFKLPKVPDVFLIFETKTSRGKPRKVFAVSIPSHVRTKGPATGVCGWMAPYELKSYDKNPSKLSCWR